jgi:hypothetical protein
MTKKQLAAIVEGVQNSVLSAHGCTEDEARTLTGMAIRKLAATLVAATNPPVPASSEAQAA